ncbi:AI-2E family transporter [Croceibacterium ferulae]|uniref:AI-2E family transporter n=1 Tax=Croceibacterium ferulae TaxID=1854641 RepID=UPI000EB3C9A6|nr:AI-2E family transporter [Croceibacterium ferulae]
MSIEETGPVPQSGHDPNRWTVGRIVTAAVAIMAVIGLAWLLVDLSQFLLLIFAAVVLACIFDALADGIGRLTGLKSRGITLTIAVLVLLLVFIGAFVLFGAQFAQEMNTIGESIPPALEQIEGLLRRLGYGGTLTGLLEQGTQDLSSIASRVGTYALAVGSGLTDFVLVFVAAIFIAADPGLHRRGLVLLMPRPAEQPAREFLDDCGNGLRGWMLGQAVSSVLVGALTWAGLALLGVPAAGGLGLIAGLLDVIPLVGPVLAGIPAVLLAFTVSPMTALWTVGLFLVIQQLQGNFLQPMIQKRAVNVPPSVLLFAVFGAGVLFGGLGVLLAAPLTIVLFLFVQRIYVRDLLGKDITVAGQEDA